MLKNSVIENDEYLATEGSGSKFDHSICDDSVAVMDESIDGLDQSMDSPGRSPKRKVATVAEGKLRLHNDNG
jgi:hypothetical protein